MMTKEQKEARKKKIFVKVRLTETERQRWTDLAASAGLPLSDLLRQSIDRLRVWSLGDRQLYGNRTRELARISSNINQIARWAIKYKSAAEAVQVMVALRAIEDKMSEFRDLKTGSEVSDAY